MRFTGKVNWFNDDRGFGFITPDDGTTDCFVHYSAIEPADADGYRTLANGAAVEFEIVQRDKGRAAEAVRVV